MKGPCFVPRITDRTTSRGGTRPIPASLRVLLGGFTPFDGQPMNASQRVVERLESIGIDGIDLITVILPVEGVVGPRRLLAAIRRHEPEVVLCLGQDGKATSLRIERVAINLRDYRVPDNAGTQVRNQPVVRGGPDALFATIPVPAIVESINAAGIPAVASLTAGSFLCNEVFYAALLALHGSATRCGFIHMPWAPEQALVDGTRSTMAIESSARGVAAALMHLRDESLGLGRATRGANRGVKPGAKRGAKPSRGTGRAPRRGRTG